MKSHSGAHGRLWRPQWAITLLGLIAIECAAIASHDNGSAYILNDIALAASDQGIPALDNYTGPYRPEIHFSPPTNFMNDPNGLHKDGEGTYHLYYQYNPTDIVPGNQHWGHATSKDLYHWENQPIAIYPPTSDTQVWSGSAVIDVNNTSGFFPNQTNGVVAIYTLNSPSAEVQEIAYSLDGGYTFTRYAGNPVLDVNSTQFRDPKVIWHEPTQRWVMVVSHAQEFFLAFYTSPDLKTWTHVSDFSHQGLLGQQWECPNLVRMPVRDAITGELVPDQDMYLLVISINPGAPLGGSVTQYYPGMFNGTTFTPVDGVARLTDFAKDNYAGQFFYGIPDDEDPISIAWASNWQYAQDAPTAQEGWRSAMSLPRRNFLTMAPRIGWVLASVPVDLSPVLGSVFFAQDWQTASNTANASVPDGVGAFYLNATVSGSGGGILDVVFSTVDSQESLSIGYSLGGDVYLNRGNTRGFPNPFFTNTFSNPILPRGDGTWTLAVVVDKSIIEVFLNDGIASATSVFYTTQPLTSISVASSGLSSGATTRWEVRAVENAWLGNGDN